MEEGPASYVVLMSGLRIGEAKDLLPLQLLLDYVGGHLGSHAEQREVREEKAWGEGAGRREGGGSSDG